MPWKDKAVKNKKSRELRKKHKGKLCHKHGGDSATPIGRHCRLCNNEMQVKWLHADPRRLLLTNSKTRAKQRGVPFFITKKDIVIPEECPVLGIKLIVGGNKLQDASPTLDRMVPELGYIPSNIRVISARANRIKNDATADELEKVLAYVKGKN